MKKSFFMLNAAIGAMTAAERSKGRYMRAPDGHGDAEFAEFEAAGDVEVGKPVIESNQDEAPAKPAKPAARAPREKPADRGADKPAKEADDKAAGKEKPGANEGGESDEDEGGEGEEEDEGGEGDEDEEEEKPKPRKKASERIRELTAKGRSQERLITQLSQRLETLEKGGLPGNRGGSNEDGGKAAPDPSDEAKYPLGHLDDRYIEDKLAYLAEKAAGERADAVLQRQQEGERLRQAEQAHAELLGKVDDLSTRGSEIYDDFQESVVDAGMRGDWRLEQPTFEAAHEAENGATILYELSQDKKEAARVASLSPYQQMRYVIDRDAEISSKAKPRTKPGAVPPPATRTNGANSRTRINPATENLDDFEKAWIADEKGK